MVVTRSKPAAGAVTVPGDGNANLILALNPDCAVAHNLDCEEQALRFDPNTLSPLNHFHLSVIRLVGGNPQ